MADSQESRSGPPPNPPGSGRPLVQRDGTLPPPPAYVPAYAAPPSPSRSRSILGRLFVSLVTGVLLCSIVINIYLWLFFQSVTGGPWETLYEPGDSEQRIVILPIMNTIDESTAVFVRTALRHLRESPPAAVVLRVDSGGGFVGPCDRIWHLIQSFQSDQATKSIPVVASFGTVAASGGYYVSTSADYIFAEPITTTGSIGVMVPMFTIDRLLEKIGITPEVLVATESPEKDVANDITRSWNEHDRMKVLEQLDKAHDRFLEIVHLGRQKHLSPEAVADLGQGDIYTTEEAIRNKLIDGEGYLDDAIAKAKALAGLGSSVAPKVTIIKPPYSMNLLSMMGRTNDAPSMWPAGQLKDLIWGLSTPRLAYRMWR